MLTRLSFVLVFLLYGLSFMATAQSSSAQSPLSVLANLKNLQINSTNMVSAGLPSNAHLAQLNEMGVTHVIDLIPGDREEERASVSSLGMDYHNIQVVWDNPTYENFSDYSNTVSDAHKNGGLVLTHCKLNWRGSVFTYLYRITVQREDEAAMKAEMLKTWQPNDIWLAFIHTVLDEYNKAHDTQITSSIQATN